METEPNISYKTATPAAKTANATSRIAEKEDVSCKRFMCILVTITLVTIISLVCLAVLFSQTPSSQNESVFMSQLEQINKSLTNIQDQITTLSRDFDTFHSDNPLWDGVGCTADNECCPTDNPPYFHKTLPQPTTDDIEMRVHVQK